MPVHMDASGRIPAAGRAGQSERPSGARHGRSRPGSGPITADASNWLADSDKVAACATRVTLLPDVRPAGRATRPQARRQAGAAGPRAVRRPPGGRPAGGPRTGRPRVGPDGDQSVFVPGYRSERPGGPAGRGAGPSAPVTAWPGPSLGDAAGRGPIRGFPPAPGQPPPLYPPGQFAAWNRPDGRVAVADPDSAWPAAPGSDWSQDRPWPADDALAVSEPSADVTATGTWRTFSDAPGRRHLEPVRAAGRRLRCPRRLRRQRASWPGTGWTRRPWPAAGRRHGTGPGRGRRDDGRATERIRRHDHRGQRRAGTGIGRDGSAGDRPVWSRKGSSRKNSPPRGPATKGASARGKKKGRSSVVLAVSAVVVLAVAAAAFLLYTASHRNSPSVAAPTSPKATRHQTASASPSPTPTDHILSRTADPLPLSVVAAVPGAVHRPGAAVRPHRRPGRRRTARRPSSAAASRRRSRRPSAAR